MSRLARGTKPIPVIIEVPRTQEDIEDAEVLEPTQGLSVRPVPRPRSRRITDAYASPPPVYPRKTIAVGSARGPSCTTHVENVGGGPALCRGAIHADCSRRYRAL